MAVKTADGRIDRLHWLCKHTFWFAAYWCEIPGQEQHVVTLNDGQTFVKTYPSRGY